MQAQYACMGAMYNFIFYHYEENIFNISNIVRCTRRNPCAREQQSNRS